MTEGAEQRCVYGGDCESQKLDDEELKKEWLKEVNKDGQAGERAPVAARAAWTLFGSSRIWLRNSSGRNLVVAIHRKDMLSIVKKAVDFEAKAALHGGISKAPDVGLDALYKRHIEYAASKADAQVAVLEPGDEINVPVGRSGEALVTASLHGSGSAPQFLCLNWLVLAGDRLDLKGLLVDKPEIVALLSPLDGGASGGGQSTDTTTDPSSASLPPKKLSAAEEGKAGGSSETN